MLFLISLRYLDYKRIQPKRKKVDFKSLINLTIKMENKWIEIMKYSAKKIQFNIHLDSSFQLIVQIDWN
jgi:hypothetical protein